VNQPSDEALQILRNLRDQADVLAFSAITGMFPEQDWSTENEARCRQFVNSVECEIKLIVLDRPSVSEILGLVPRIEAQSRGTAIDGLRQMVSFLNRVIDRIEQPNVGSSDTSPGEDPVGDVSKTAKPLRRGNFDLQTAEGRQAAVKAYRDHVYAQTGARITKSQIWREAGYPNHFRECEHWQKNDPKTPHATHEHICRVLFEDQPHLRDPSRGKKPKKIRSA